MASTRSPLLWSGSARLAHGWTLVRGPSMSKALVREFIRPAVRAVPCSMVRRLGSCRISLPAEVASGVSSRWTITNGGLEVTVTAAGLEEHDVAMELLLCLGQGLWERLADGELRAYWMLLNDEISLGIEGQIDEQALEEKRSLFESRSHANNAKRRLLWCGKTARVTCGCQPWRRYSTERTHDEGESSTWDVTIPVPCATGVVAAPYR